MQRLLQSVVAANRERGLQLAAFQDGVLVVNAFAGTASAESGIPVNERTLFPVFSVTKGITAALIHLLAERGRLSYEDPISRCWPEFGCHAKEHITIRQVLNHTAGLPHMPRGLSHSTLCDWDKMCAILANLTPSWEPGSRMEYHAMTFGWILGEVARRSDGRSFAELMNEEVCRPLGIEDMHVGIPDGVETRIAILEQPDAPEPVEETDTQSVPGRMLPLHAWMNRADARHACVPASNGIMSALAIARFYAALIPGGVDGVTLWSADRMKIATEPQTPEHAQGEGSWSGRGLGFEIGGHGSVLGDSPAAFGHGGYGGSIGFANPELRLAVGLTRNLFHDDQTVRLILDELQGALLV